MLSIWTPFPQVWAMQSLWQCVACVCIYSFQLLLPWDDSIVARKADITPHWPHPSTPGLCCHTVFQSHMLLPCISVWQQYFYPHDLRLIWEGTLSRTLCREDESHQRVRPAEGPWGGLQTIINAYFFVNRTFALLLMYSSHNLYAALCTESRCLAPIWLILFCLTRPPTQSALSRAVRTPFQLLQD